jgi:hypothetical protein
VGLPSRDPTIADPRKGPCVGQYLLLAVPFMIVEITPVALTNIG